MQSNETGAESLSSAERVSALSNDLGASELGAAARALYADKTAADVIQHLEGRGIGAILLKGPAIGALISEPTRTYVDCDILVPSDLFDDAEATLAEMGLRPVELDVFKHDWPRHAHTWIGLNGAEVDLHRTFIGVEVDQSLLFGLLKERTEEMEVGGRRVRVLEPSSRLLFLVLHAAKDGTRVGRPVRDLEKAVERIAEDVWVEAAEVAKELDALPSFIAGLTLVPEGANVIDRLAIQASPKTATLIRTEEGAPALAVGVDWFVRQRSLPRMFSLAVHKTFPPASFMRAWSPLARRGGWGLIAAYLWRPLWLLRKLGPAVGAWRRARRRSRQLALANLPITRETIQHKIPLPKKVAMFRAILVTFVVVQLRLRRSTLPAVVTSLREVDTERDYRLDPRRLGRIVFRTLRLGNRHARCLINALVLFRLLRLQGDNAELVIGLPESPQDVSAHAWIELDGDDVGPPPGRGAHKEFTRYS
jgi:hypothetical protein